MYFLLESLLGELWYTTVTVPKMLAIFSVPRVISVPTASPVLLLLLFGCHGALHSHHHGLDRYAATADHSTTHYCSALKLVVSWLGSAGLWDSSAPCSPHSSLQKPPSVPPTRSNHFFCDADQIFRLSCTDTYAIQAVGYAFSTVIILGTLVFTMASYAQFLATILGMASAAARRKTFSTCTAHLSVVTIYFGTLIFMYVRPAVKYESNINKIVAIFYSVITPLLNPLIYTLRNKDVKEALKVLVSRMQKFCCPSKETK
ncbi:olfactory receptor 6Q1-like [Sus scrofa]|uniref:olfactory receptor 6Q1-like n=1 Tax=Sus scrofa TaxID=9823 RepID=UPI000A2B0BF7|nr:olfactory receptor 6Q1-like [Sus scrofa]